MYHRLIILVLSLSLSSVYAKDDKQLYTIEKGTIVYEVRGSTQFSLEANLSIQGKVSLRFKDWGSTIVEEENGLLLMHGAVEHRENVKNFIKYSDGKIISVDYANAQLIEGKVPSRDRQDNATKNLKLVGKKMIVGFECDIWKGSHIEKCLYKGLVLSIESKVYNAHYSKKAISIILDKNMTEYDFMLPDYPMHQIGFLKEYKKLQKTNSFGKIIKKNSTEENKTTFLIHLGKDIFNQQKKLLPKLLLLMKKTRESLQSVEIPFDDDDCIGKFTEMNMYTGAQKEVYALLWDEKSKVNLLNKLENDLLSLESKIPCIKRAKNILDLSKCMKSK